MGLYKAILNSVLGKFAIYIIQFLALAVYSRIYSPQEFGLIAAVQIVVLFLQLLTEMGFGPAIINEKSLLKRDMESLYGFTLIIGFLGALGLYFLAAPIAFFYTNVDIIPVVELMAPAVLFSALTIIPLTENIKHARFKTIAAIDILSECLTFFAIMYLWKIQVDFLSLALRPFLFSVCRYLFNIISLYLYGSGFYKLRFKFEPVRRIATFSVYQFLFNVMNFFSRNIDSILVGRYFGPAILGQYDKAYQLMRYPLMLTTFAVTPAIQPILTNYSDDRKLILIEHNKLAMRLLAIALPITLFLSINTEELVLFLFGPQWGAAANYIMILGISIPIQTMMSSSGAFFQVLNKPKILFVSGVISSVINICGISLGVYYHSIDLLCAMIVVTFTINFIITYYLLFNFCFCNSSIPFYWQLFKVISLSIIPGAIYSFFAIYLKRVDLDAGCSLVINGVAIALIFIPFLLFIVRRVK
ncbi:oligosaccharide flippase family protein [Citrobacter braakii]|uniref:oligosaccharide flippase family protein n=1 Tax=Citrobacter braakii TaxID=57706 RepID=UPI0013F1738C|nr:oligosaccharide flippase family protein [Citrobacter braakii]HAT7502872.1 oligosaccharide flippase family protein [Citrobacter braakii]